jgi:hypothetical protein
MALGFFILPKLPSGSAAPGHEAWSPIDEVVPPPIAQPEAGLPPLSARVRRRYSDEDVALIRSLQQNADDRFAVRLPYDPELVFDTEVDSAPAWKRLDKRLERRYANELLGGGGTFTFGELPVVAQPEAAEGPPADATLSPAFGAPRAGFGLDALRALLGEAALGAGARVVIVDVAWAGRGEVNGTFRPAAPVVVGAAGQAVGHGDRLTALIGGHNRVGGSLLAAPGIAPAASISGVAFVNDKDLQDDPTVRGVDRALLQAYRALGGEEGSAAGGVIVLPVAATNSGAADVVPVEMHTLVADNLRLLRAAGVLVVASASNTRNDLSLLRPTARGYLRLDQIPETGSLLVAACGRDAVDDDSAFGDRVDLCAWGGGIRIHGGGVSGATSAAAAAVGGVAAVLQGVVVAWLQTPADADALAGALTADDAGYPPPYRESPLSNTSTGHGYQPDLLYIVLRMLGEAPRAAVRAHAGGAMGVVATQDLYLRSGEIVVRPDDVAFEGEPAWGEDKPLPVVLAGDGVSAWIDLHEPVGVGLGAIVVRAYTTRRAELSNPGRWVLQSERRVADGLPMRRRRRQCGPLPIRYAHAPPGVNPRELVVVVTVEAAAWSREDVRRCVAAIDPGGWPKPAAYWRAWTVND